MMIIKLRATKARSSVMIFAMIFRPVGKGQAVAYCVLCKRVLHKIRCFVYYCVETAQVWQWQSAQPFDRTADSSGGSRLTVALLEKADF